MHQKLADGSFDMRDHLVVDRTSLRPITFESQRGANRESKGWHHVVLRYASDRVTGMKETRKGTVNIDVPFDRPIWDGNLWGITFAALPLRTGGRYSLPFWQYDKGFGTFTVNVVGRETTDSPGGRVNAWVLEAAMTRPTRFATSLPLSQGWRSATAPGHSHKNWVGIANRSAKVPGEVRDDRKAWSYH